jgi:YidC/Oxa1 family membrane protein insertase
MPKEKNTLLRIVVPVALGIVGLGVAVSIFRTSTPSAVSGPSAFSGPTPGQAPTTPAVAASGGASVAAPSAPPAAGAALVALDWNLQPLVWTTPVAAAQPMGSATSTDPASMRLEFSEAGAGIKSLTLNREFLSIKEDANVVVQQEVAPMQGETFTRMAPFAAMGVRVTPPKNPDGTQLAPVFVNLFSNTGGVIWRPTGAPGAFEATVINGAREPVLTITRVYALGSARGDVSIAQRIENKIAAPMTVEWFQYGPIDPPDDAMISSASGKPVHSYGGDKRRMRFGYLLNANSDPTRSHVVSDEYLISRSTALGSREQVVLTSDGQAALGADGKPIKTYKPEVAAWPSEVSTKSGHELVWAGFTNRYFGVAVHPLTQAGAVGAAKTFPWASKISRVVHDPGLYREVMALRLDSKALALAPAGLAGSDADLSMGMYAGPLDTRLINADPTHKSLGLDGLVVYNFGGPCAVCTFSWMTGLLLGLLHFLHDFLFKDWALAIIFLVVIVRSVLHPVTRWSQIRLARFGKQMSAVGPKQKVLQEKYKNDPKLLQAETAKLWREEGISPTGALGCIPMFLQMPVWIALYATLFFAYELRHQGGFYGVFQHLQPGTSPFWRFLGDLAEPDRFYYFGQYFNVPLLSFLLGPIHSINILPVILGVVFFIQQKYLTPPTGTPLTPEQEMQQKMMKWMMVIMFPLFMYNAPSGLALYFIANSTLGILESKWIRAHMDKHGLLDLEKMRAEAKQRRAAKGDTGEGFIARMQRMAEQQAKLRDQKKK